MTLQTAVTSKLRSGQRGQTVVEFALIALVLMVIVIAILDFGRAVFAYSVVANCAREGARFGSMAPEDDAGMIAAARDTAIGLDPARLTVTLGTTADTVQVTVRYGFEPITPLVAQFLVSGGVTLTSSATMYTGF